MPLINQQVRELFGGVSQLPTNQRDASELEEQVNALTYQGRVLGKRPPTVHVGQLSTDTTGTAFVHTVSRSAIEKYVAMVLNGVLTVHNQFTGATVTCHTPDGVGYLADDSHGYRAITVGEQTVLVNRAVVTTKGTTVSSAGGETVLVVVRQGNFGTKYRITIGAISTTYTTPKSSATDAELDIDTDEIATELTALLNANGTLTAAYTFTRTGSVIAVAPDVAGTVFKVTTEDGLGNEGMAVLKGSVQRFTDLPEQAPDGTLLEVRGDDATKFDNYWVQYQQETGVWEEVVAPGVLTDFDASTMPHLLEFQGKFVDSAAHDATAHATVFTNTGLGLTINALAGRRCMNITDGSEGVITSNTATTITTVLSGGGTNQFNRGDVIDVLAYGEYFVFREAPWGLRAAGDLDTNPYPSFVGGRIRDIFVTQGRLGIIAPKSIILSRTRKPFELFRETVTQVLPDGPIDITEALPGSALFHAHAPWAGRDLIFTDQAQYELGGDPVLTPETVSLRPVGQYPNLSTCRPISSGNRVFFVGLSNALPRIMEFTVYGQEQRLTAESITETIPTYLDGFPIQLAADDTLGLLFVLTEDGTLYVCSYSSLEGQRMQLAWGRWNIAGST